MLAKKCGQIYFNKDDGRIGVLTGSKMRNGVQFYQGIGFDGMDWSATDDNMEVMANSVNELLSLTLGSDYDDVSVKRTTKLLGI